MFFHLNASVKRFWIGLGFLSIAFHLWLIFSGLVPNLVSRPLHLALAIPWIYLYSTKNTKGSIFEQATCLLLTLIGVLICVLIAINHSTLGDQYGYIANRWQLGLAIVLLLIVIDMARRAIGWPLPSIALLALTYAVFGHNLPGEFGFSQIPLNSLLGTLTIAEGGLWGQLAGISVSIVAVFVIFGAFLNAGEAGEGFMNIAAAVGGRYRGGAAKMSVVSSALFGSLSGSASANVASTGAITLPTMIKLGYPRALAGATEAVASSGGQIMPPLMGAGAFVMVELTGIPYASILSAALLPALLYFFAVWVGIDAYSQRLQLKPIGSEMQPAIKVVFITAGFFMLPFSVLLLGMFVWQVTPQYAASLAILLTCLLLTIDASLRFDNKRFRLRLQRACIASGQQIALIASIIFCASIIVGVLSITGLGVKITSIIIAASGGMLWPALGLTALACLVLGMEVPTTAAYVICVSVAGSALTQLGLQPIQTHLFIFWYALLSSITPPVCGAVFIAAGMVQENWLRVARHAVILGVGLYLVPLSMIVTPQILAISTQPILALMSFLKMGIALALVAYASIAAGSRLKRGCLIIVGLALVFVPLAPQT